RFGEQRTNSGKLGGGGPAKAGQQLGGPIHHRRVGIERLPQGGQVRRDGIPALAAFASQRRASEQPLAEAVVQFQQVGLDGVALGDRGRDRGGRLFAAEQHGHRYSASRRDSPQAQPAAISTAAAMITTSRPA